MSNAPLEEYDIVACVLSFPDALDEVRGIINPADIANPSVRAIWHTIIDLDGKKRPFDASSLEQYLIDTGRERYLDVLRHIVIECPSTPVNIAMKAKIIRQRSIKRMLSMAGQRITELANESAAKDLAQVLGEAESILSDVVAGNLSDDIEVVDGVTLGRRVWDDLGYAMENKGISGMTTGIRSLDDLTDGLQKSSMVVVAGPPSMGKTAFAVNMMRAALDHCSKPCVMFSMEMPANDIGRRMLSSESKINYSKIRRGGVTDEEISAMLVGIRRIQNPMLKIVPAGMMTPARMRAVLKRIAREHGGISMAMVDYIQLMDADKSSPNNRTQELGIVSRELKRMAMEFEMPFLVLSQLTKDVEKAKRKPTNGDLRESGQIAQDADLIMMVHRQEKYDDTPKLENLGKAEIVVTKNRNGATGSVIIGFDGPTFRFYELAPDEYQEYAA